MSSVRENVLEAAITLLGTEGLRSLTHTRVDARAGVPRGSTSNYFRTRAALLEGTVDRMVQLELPLVDVAYSPTTADELADALHVLFERMTNEGRVLTTARLVLLMEASHDEAVRTALARGRGTMEEIVIPAARRLGSPDPELASDALSACFEGLFLQVIARGTDVDAHAVLRRVVQSVLN